MFYTLNEKIIPALSEIGGKAKTLMEMSEAGFPVPEGIVLPASFFSPWMDMLKKQDAWIYFLYDKSQENCDKLKKTAQSLKMNNWQWLELTKAMKHFSQTELFAVRSSSPEEDLETASFAGEYETTLGVPYEGLEKAVACSFASMLDYRVVEYKNHHTIQTDDPKIAVIIQKQIPSDVSGVGFSANPQNGAEDEVMLNASFGLGEAIVAGLVTPDIYIIKGNKIIDKKIAEKHMGTYLKTGGYTKDLDIPTPKKESLTKKQALELAKMIKNIAEYYQKPMDTEWAIAGKTIYLLQARPITTKLIKINWDLDQEEKGMMFARASIIELMPDPLSPLYIDYATRHVPSSLIKLFSIVLGETDANKLKPGIQFSTKNGFAYLGYKITGYFMLPFITHAGKLIKLFNQHPSWVENEKLPAIKKRLAELKGINLQNAKLKTLYDMSHELTETMCIYFTYCQIYLAQAMSFELLFSRYYDKKIKPLVGIPSYIFMLGDDTAPILADKALYQLAQDIKKDTELMEFVLSTSNDKLKMLMACDEFKDHRFYTLFKNYLDTHGNMLYDLDFAKPTPRDDPRPIIETLKLYIIGHGENPEKRQREALIKRGESEQKVEAAVSKGKFRRFMAKLEKARETAPFREEGLANMGLCQPLLRKILFELGRRLENKKIIDNHEDIFWLKEEELLKFIDGFHILPLTEAVSERKALWRTQKEMTPPALLPKDIRFFGLKMNDFMPAKDIQEHKGNNKYEGIGVSSGTVTGTAKVIHGTDEFNTMEEGDILVTSMTTPAWTPLFAMASAVVTDYGGPLSHSSIVAREYGIPAVLGTGGLSKIIHSGQIITVDADHSAVYLSNG